MNGINQQILHNRPADRGTLPGTRITNRFYSGSTGKTLSDHENFVFTIPGAGRMGALIGASAKIIMRVTVTEQNGNNITSTMNCGLRDEAHNLVWEMLTLRVNDSDINSGQRADVTRHIKDRYLTSAASRLAGSNSRLLKEDKNLSNKGTGGVNKDLIINGQTFELVRPLDDLPLFGEKDALIPSFLNLSVQCTLGKLQNLFFTTTIAGGVTSTTLTLKECYLAIDWIGVEPMVIQDWVQSFQTDRLRFDTYRWFTHQENLPSGITQYNTKSLIGLHNVPHFIICQIYDQQQFSGTGAFPHYNGHPLLAEWADTDVFTINNNATDIVRYQNIQTNKADLYTSMHYISSTGYNEVNCAFDAFITGDMACFPKVYRSYDDVLTQPTELVNYRIGFEFNTALPLDKILFTVSLSRQGYLVTPRGVRTVNLAI